MAEYVPQNPAEQYFYDALWKYANPSGDGELSGKAAVTFFQMSGVDIGILKQIWSLSTPTASMNKDQFFSAIRYITMMQQGEIPLNKGIVTVMATFKALLIMCCVVRETSIF